MLPSFITKPHGASTPRNAISIDFQTRKRLWWPQHIQRSKRLLLQIQKRANTFIRLLGYVIYVRTVITITEVTAVFGSTDLWVEGRNHQSGYLVAKAGFDGPLCSYEFRSVCTLCAVHRGKATYSLAFPCLLVVLQSKKAFATSAILSFAAGSSSDASCDSQRFLLLARGIPFARPG